MQASDYRFVDVSGINIADKILPKMDTPDGFAVYPERAEDAAFLYEAVNERGRTEIPTFSDLTCVKASTSLDYSILRVTQENIINYISYRHWVDWDAVGSVVDMELEGNNPNFGPGLWPDLFPGQLAPPAPRLWRLLQIDPIRRMYWNLKHHEGYIGNELRVRGTHITKSPPSYPDPLVEDVTGIGRYDFFYWGRDDFYPNAPKYYTVETNLESAFIASPENLNVDPESGILVMHVEASSARNIHTPNYEKHYVVVIKNVSAGAITDSLSNIFSSIPMEEPYPEKEIRVVDYFTICPFEGRTKLRDIPWEWGPAST